MFAALRLLILALTAIIAVPAAAETDDATLAKLVANLGAKSFSKKAQAIDALSATGDARVVAILEAMLSRHLYYRKTDRTIVIAVTEDTTLIVRQALTGAVIDGVQKSGLKSIRINNRLRKILQGAIGSLSLHHKDRKSVV